MFGWRLIKLRTLSEANRWYYTIGIGEFAHPRRGPYDTRAAAVMARRRERASLERAKL